MQTLIFDIDGTLTQSTSFDATCLKEAVLNHADIEFKDDWADYQHVTDSGILNEIIESYKLTKHKAELTRRIKSDFIELVHSHVQQQVVPEVSGAAAFIEFVKTKPDVRFGIATGGWGETAKLKLRSAGIDINGVDICSANDAISRVDIMKLALAKSGAKPRSKITYYGDATWDKKACLELDWNLVIVGNQVDHHQTIEDFSSPAKAFAYSNNN